MKNIIFGFIIFLLLAFASIAPEKGAGIWYFSGVPDTAAETTLGSEVAFNYADKSLWVWDRTGSAWEYLNKIQYKAGTPSGAPTNGNIGYFDTTTGIFYRWTGAAWIELSEVSIDPASSPSLTETGGVFTLDYANLVASDANSIALAIGASPTAVTTLKDSSFILFSDGTNTIQAKDTFTFTSNQTAIVQTIGGTTANGTLTTDLDLSNLGSTQTSNMATRLTLEGAALAILNAAISSKPILATIANGSGQDIHAKYLGKAPTFTGNNGVFTLAFDRDSTDLQSWRFGGGTGESVWDGSGDLSINITISGGNINTDGIDEYFANLQLVNSGNNEVLSDPKGQLTVSIFQERTATGTVQIRASNLNGFSTEGFKLTANY